MKEKRQSRPSATTQDAPSAPASAAPTQTEYTYAPGRNLIAIQPSTPGPHRMVIDLHGGGFKEKSFDGYRDRAELQLCTRIAQEADVAVFSVQYRIEKMPAPIDDVLEAYDWLTDRLTQFNLTNDAPSIVATSAGAILGITTALWRAPTRPFGLVIANSGALFDADIAKLKDKDRETVAALFGRGDLDTEDGSAAIADYLPQRNIRKPDPAGSLPDFLFTWSDNDERIDPSNYRDLIAAMRAAGMSVDEVINHVGHGLGNLTTPEAWAKAMAALKAPAQQAA